MTTITRQIVGEEGQISLPSDILHKLRLAHGALVEIIVEGRQITLREPLDPAAAWLGAAPLPDGQTEADFMREVRGKNEDSEEASDEQRILWLKTGQPLPESL